MDRLTAAIHEAVSTYVGRGVNGYSYLIADAVQPAWTIIFVLNFNGQRIVRSGLIVRLLGETILIEQDDNDPPLVDALLQAGIPRSQIILAYAGEPVPESA